MITLNLLPPAVKRNYESAEQLHHWLRALIVVALTVFVGTAGVVGLWVMLDRHASTVRTELQEVHDRQATSSGQDIETITQQLNTTIKLLTTTLGTPRSWTSDTADILSGLPTTISISSVEIKNNGQFHLVGVADSRQSFVQLEGVLKTNTKLSNIFTTTTASKRVAVPFDFTGQLVSSSKL